MAPKKQKQEEWSECVKCKRVVHKSDTMVHRENCKAVTGFVFNNVLHGLFIPHTSNTKAILSKVGNSKDSIALLNPSVMSLCGLALGHPCLVNKTYVLMAWPCKSVPPTGICLPPPLSGIISGTATDQGGTVVVRPFVPPASLATKVEIELKHDDELFLSDDFLEILKCKMEGKYVACHTKHAIFYLGLTCHFYIKALQCRHPQQTMYELVSTAPEQSSNNLPDEGKLCHKFSSLDISVGSEIGDTKQNSSLLVTPTKQQDSDSNNSFSSSSPSITQTPEHGAVGRPEQFCTPVLRNVDEHSDESQLPEFVKVTADTQFALLKRGEGGKETLGKEHKITFGSLGGLDSQIEKIREYCLFPLQALRQSGSDELAIPRGILLFGPTGTGKSMFAQAIANEFGIYTTFISPTDLYSKFYGETEKRLRNIFETAKQRSPSLIIVDNIDSLCGSRQSSQSDLEKRTVATFLTLLDGTMTNQKADKVCIVIGITSQPDTLTSALRRPGRLDMEIETGVPTAADRLQILGKLLKDIPHSLSHTQLKGIADAAHGYVGADLAGVVVKARQNRWRLTKDASAPLMIEDMKQAATSVPPSAMREVQLEVPQVRWSDIGGQEELKLKLKQAVEWPLTNPEAFKRMGIAPPRGCLMYGPPGCSKTMIAKALATESGLNFLAVKGPELFGKYVGESERAVREIFRKARSAAPSIIFFDEIDSLAVERGKSGGGNNVADRVLTQLLTEMDGVVQLKEVTIVAATNRPDMIDKALLRPGRFDRIIYVPLPDAAARKEILQIITRKTPTAPDVSLQELVNRTQRFSGAELTALCHEAGLCAITESREARIVHMRHFEAALKTIQPQTTQEMIKFYEDYSSKSGLHSV